MQCVLILILQIYIPSGKGPRYILVGAGSCHGRLFRKVFRSNTSGDYHSAMNADHFEVNDLNFTFSYLSLCSNKSTITTEFLVKFLYNTCDRSSKINGFVINFSGI